MKPENLVTLRVWGDFACFTRPEMKVERVSYPLITPSAARGVLEAVFWEPQMLFWIDSIRVVKRGKWISVRRNEVTQVISLSEAKTWITSPQKAEPIQAGGGAADGTQRNMLALSEVEYLITAEIRLSSLARPPKDNIGKYRDEFHRRAQSGKCHHRPGLGMREFAADFDWEDDPEAALLRRRYELTQQGIETFPWHEDLGLMLYDVFSHTGREKGFQWMSETEVLEAETAFEQALAGVAKGEQTKRKKAYAANPVRHKGEIVAPQPCFFKATLRDGTMDCYPDRVTILTPNPIRT
jgi:CRISPR-associated protein Cas5d